MIQSLVMPTVEKAYELVIDLKVIRTERVDFTHLSVLLTVEDKLSAACGGSIVMVRLE